MDCVGCEKCRLWGKVQVTGLGTALKILFSYKSKDFEYINLILDDLQPTRSANYKLTRPELVSLINTFNRVAESVHVAAVFEKKRREKLLNVDQLMGSHHFSWTYVAGIIIAIFGVWKTWKKSLEMSEKYRCALKEEEEDKNK